jgi:LDH2 family malate/lactate/ureidoglycolate dehydrogenase
MTDQKLVPVKSIGEFLQEAFQRMGVPKEDALICADVLLTADIQGVDSHGIALLKTYYEKVRLGIQLPKTDLKILKETDTTATIDGAYGMGELIGYRAMEIALRKAKTFGLGAVAVRHSSHFGFAGYYALMATKENMMGLAMTNASPAIAPTFGVEPMLGTNPIAFGAPSDMEFPFVMDFAISLMRKNKIAQLAHMGESMIEGWAIGQNGKPYTNGNKLRQDVKSKKAALLPIGGSTELLGSHKGYGLATMVEILSSALQGGSSMNELFKMDQNGELVLYGPGHFFLALNIENFIEPAICKSIIGQIMRNLKDSRKMPGEETIYVAGEKEYKNQIWRLQHGIPLNKDVVEDLRSIHSELGMGHYDFL